MSLLLLFKHRFDVGDSHDGADPDKPGFYLPIYEKAKPKPKAKDRLPKKRKKRKEKDVVLEAPEAPPVGPDLALLQAELLAIQQLLAAQEALLAQQLLLAMLARQAGRR